MSGSSLVRRGAYALAVAGAATALWGTVVPSQDSLTSHSRQQELQQQYGTARERELENLERRGALDADALLQDQKQAREERALARSAARGLLRRVP